MRHARILAAVILLLLFAVLAFTACGGDDDGGSSSDNATATPTREQETSTPEGGSATEPATATATETAEAITLALADPCSLITKEEAAAALGQDISDPLPVQGLAQQVSGDIKAQVSVCSYIATSGVDSVSIDIWAAPGHADAIGQLVGFICSTKEAVGAIGDQACWYNSDHSEMQLQSGSYYLDLRALVGGVGGTGAEDVLLTLAPKAIDRLP